MNDTHYNSSDVCFQPGWDSGPDHTGEGRSIYWCEKPGDHTGDHGWDEDFATGEFLTTWPVDEVSE